MTVAEQKPSRRVTRRSAILVVAAAAAVAAVLVALLSNGGHTGISAARRRARGQTVVQIAAGYLGIPPSELRRRLRSGQTLAEVIAATKGASQAGLVNAAYRADARAVKRRHLPPAAERAELALLRRWLSTRIARPPRPHRVPPSARLYLGIGEAELRTQLAGGRTLGTLAAATPGRSRKGLIEALLAARLKALDRALREKQITAQAERRAAATLRQRTVRLVNRPGG